MSSLLLYVLFVCLFVNGISTSIPGASRRWISFGDHGWKHCNDAGCFASNVSSIGLETAKSAGASFVQTLPLSVSVSMVFNSGKLPNVKSWFVSSVREGTDMARYSAVFKGSETLVSRLRNKNDRQNVWFGSGVAGAFHNIKNGPFAMVKGFGQGFGLMYSIDKIRSWAENNKATSEEH